MRARSRRTSPPFGGGGLREAGERSRRKARRPYYAGLPKRRYAGIPRSIRRGRPFRGRTDPGLLAIFPPWRSGETSPRRVRARGRASWRGAGREVRARTGGGAAEAGTDRSRRGNPRLVRGMRRPRLRFTRGEDRGPLWLAAGWGRRRPRRRPVYARRNARGLFGLGTAARGTPPRQSFASSPVVTWPTLLARSPTRSRLLRVSRKMTPAVPSHSPRFSRWRWLRRNCEAFSSTRCSRSWK